MITPCLQSHFVTATISREEPPYQRSSVPRIERCGAFDMDEESFDHENPPHYREYCETPIMSNVSYQVDSLKQKAPPAKHCSQTTRRHKGRLRDRAIFVSYGMSGQDDDEDEEEELCLIQNVAFSSSAFFYPSVHTSDSQADIPNRIQS